MKHNLIILSKLIFASSLIFLIGFGFLTLSPQDDGAIVEEANADIYSFAGFDEKHNFSRAMKSIGITPRPYDFNGNLMYFGTTRLPNSRSARESAEMIQRQLVTHGVNKKNYLREEGLKTLSRNPSKSELLNQKEIFEAMLSGEVLPTKKDNKVYEMSGLIGMESVEEFTKNLKHNRGKSLGDLTNGYRYVEIHQSPDSTTAEVLAVWTADDFDSGKMTNDRNARQSEPDPEIPSCIGCKRIHRVQALAKSEPYNINYWTTNSHPFSTYSFYLNAMENRGWKISEKQNNIDKLSDYIPELQTLSGRSITCEKDSKVIEITITPKDDGGADVMTIEKYDKVQPILDESHQENTRTLADEVNRFFE